MGHIFATIGLAYVVVSGTITTSCVVGRGMVKAARQAAWGNLGEAGVEVMAAVAAPTVLAYQAGGGLICEVVEGSLELIDGLLAGKKQKQAPMPNRNSQPVCC